MISSQILLHPKTANQITAAIEKPSHAFMIIGPAGSGKKTVAAYLAASLLDVSPDKLNDQPYYTEIIRPAAKTEIPIESVRELIKGLRLKTPGRRRIVLIDEAHSLSEEAQNALLKAIEEPPADTVFILNVLTPASVLPTIASRSQKLTIYPLTREDAGSLFNDFDQKEVDSAWRLARGGAGLMAAILKDNKNHALKQAVDEAKLFLRMDKFQRVVFLDRLAGDKPRLTLFIDALDRVCAALSDASAKNQRKSQLVKLTKARRQLNEALESLDRNVSARLIALDLALSLSL